MPKKDYIGTLLEKLDNQTITLKIFFYLCIAVIISVIALLFSFPTIYILQFFIDSTSKEALFDGYKIYEGGSSAELLGQIQSMNQYGLVQSKIVEIFLGWLAFLGILYMLVFEYGRKQEDERIKRISKDVASLKPIPLSDEVLLQNETYDGENFGKNRIKVLSNGKIFTLYKSFIYNNYERWVNLPFIEESVSDLPNSSNRILFSVINTGKDLCLPKEMWLLYKKNNVSGKFNKSEYSINEDISEGCLENFNESKKCLHLVSSINGNREEYVNMFRHMNINEGFRLVIKYDSVHNQSIGKYGVFSAQITGLKNEVLKGLPINDLGLKEFYDSDNTLFDKWISAFVPLSRDKIKLEIEEEFANEILQNYEIT